MTVTLPVATGGRRFIGPADLKPKGFPAASAPTELAAAAVVLVKADGETPLIVLGQTTGANSVPVVPASDVIAPGIGALTEGAPSTDTASSGLNGRLQRIAQRLTSLIALLPTALGAGGGLKVDGSGTALPVSVASALPTGTNVIGKTIASEASGTLSVANGQTTSGALDIDGYRFLGLVVPSTFDGTTISFQVSHDNSTYQALYDITNTLVAMTLAASRSYDLPGELTAWRHIKIVTGTAQTGATDFVMMLKS